MVDRLNTKNMLRRRHYTMVDNNYACMLCQNPPEETVEHLFFTCPFSQQCWARLGVSWPASGNRITLLHEGRDRWRRPLFMDVFMLAAWSIWKERNNKHFRGIPHSFNYWLTRFKELLGLLAHNCKQGLRPFISSYIQTL
jgi:hypothetical protein